MKIRKTSVTLSNPTSVAPSVLHMCGEEKVNRMILMGFLALRHLRYPDAGIRFQDFESQLPDVRIVLDVVVIRRIPIAVAPSVPHLCG